MYDRRSTIGASDAVLIAAGQWAELYEKKTRDTPSDDARSSLPAAIGKALEPLHREWFVKQALIGVPEAVEKHGLDITSDTNRIIYHPEWADDPFRQEGCDAICYTPDGLIETGDNWFLPVELKAVNPFWQPLNLKNRYMPQCQHGMRVMKAPACIFSVIYLNVRWEWEVIPYDPIYDQQLERMERQFLWHLKEGVAP